MSNKFDTSFGKKMENEFCPNDRLKLMLLKINASFFQHSFTKIPFILFFQGVPTTSRRFLFDGERIRDDQTPKMVRNKLFAPFW